MRRDDDLPPIGVMALLAMDKVIDGDGVPQRTLDKEGWWDVVRCACPAMPRSAFDRHWEEFHKRKAEGSLVRH